PEATQQAAAAVLDGRIVVAGGWDSTGTATDATWIYDPEANEWSPGSPMPTAVSAPGQAVLDGRLYAVGGCTTGECFPIVNTVQVYDLDTDAWSEGTGLPEATTFSACGGMDGALICTGGVGEAGEGLATTLLYDPGSGTWDPLPDAPAATWGASYAAVNGMLVVNGGIQDNALTNRTFAYNPAEGGWVDLPASNQAVYRGGGACGFARAGGDTGGFLPTSHAELLPGLDICDESTADVPWLELDTTEAVLEPGQSVTVQVSTHSAAVAQPGTYTAQVGVNANAPERPDRVEVAMTVTPPLSWGKLEGTAYLQACDGGAVAGDSITIDIKPTRDGVGTGWVVSTNHEGYYARWINTQIGELRVTATLPGFRPDTALVELVRGGITTQDLYLLNAGCEDNPTPVPPQVVRLDGVDRYDTAARVSALFPPRADTVFVATGENYPDALAAAARAGSLGGPVLLTHPDELPQVTRIELQRLRPDTVILVGGTAAVSGPVEDELRAAAPGATVTRYAGKDRYETAGLIAQDVATAEVVYVATGRNFPDALAGAARAGALDAPVLLVTPDAVPAATARQLDRLDPERIVLLGGTGAVSTQVEEELEGYGPVQRVAGADRYGTAVMIAQDYETSHDVFVATGLDWPDALAGAARSGHVEAPMLLVKTSTIPPVTWDELERLDPGRVFVLGGEEAVGPEVVDRLLTLE
ncbi:MAG: cell wall-binding repeat-containing protein, partial [Actinobacteria bacterium]|nr:cell wall-binding repeat-containing protein [Actinomycetota bacterium]